MILVPLNLILVIMSPLEFSKHEGNPVAALVSEITVSTTEAY